MKHSCFNCPKIVTFRLEDQDFRWLAGSSYKKIKLRGKFLKSLAGSDRGKLSFMVTGSKV